MLRKNWPLCLLIFGLMVLLGWAMSDGGKQPTRELSAPTSLPTVVQ